MTSLRGLVLSVVAVVAASWFAGASTWPLLGRFASRRASSSGGEGELAVALEHVATDVRLGRGAAALPVLVDLMPRVGQPETRARLCDLEVEAALQAGRLDLAEKAEAERAALTLSLPERLNIQLRLIGLYGARGKSAPAEHLAEEIIKTAPDPFLADEARWRVLAATQSRDALQAWLQSIKREATEMVRRLGWAALRVLDRPADAARLLSIVEESGQKDPSLYSGLLEANLALGRPREVARVSAALAALTGDERERGQLDVMRARSMAQAGDVDAALAVLTSLLAGSGDLGVRQVARQARYQLLLAVGRLPAEIARLERPHASASERAARAYVALEIERNYALAERLYAELQKADPDSPLFVGGRREAAHRKQLAARKAHDEQVLRDNVDDRATREELLAVLIELGELEAARQAVARWMAARADDPQALVVLAGWLDRSGLVEEAGRALARAFATENSATRKQQILIALGDLYAKARQPRRAERLFTDLAAQGQSPEIRAQAVAHLATLLQN